MAENTYKNISGAPVLGNSPGAIFKADIPDAQRKRMEDRGSIEEVDPSQLSLDTPEESESTETPAEVPHDDAAASSSGGDDKGGSAATTSPSSAAGAGGKVPPAGKKG